MPRQSRKQSGTGIYHVILRGINRQDIFEDQEDHNRFISCLQQMVKPFDDLGKPLPPYCIFYAYCLMSNHVHLLVRVRQEDIGNTIRHLTVMYAIYFNRKYSRVGHLFQDRFKSEPVNDMNYFVTLLRYIHQNPIKAGMVQSVAEHPWSSWQEYQGKVPTELAICTTSAVLKRMTIEELSELVDTPLEDDICILDIDENPKVTIGDMEVRQFLLKSHGIQNPIDVQKLEKNQRNAIIVSLIDIGAGFRQIARITGVPYGVIYRLKK